ncbi:glycoside hydrolase family 88 protein [Paenibacillus koleovorans]|uniref:glycoside hydrolase family 88 protein n=1 Tax=Paenibacillus koleovorans TaxID=121608 RepID=UPI0013E3C8B8|nr:glycoside hydrolase family 88 protein [Paenibacillus koleovorans]
MDKAWLDAFTVEKAYLRLTVAIDVREEKEIEVLLPESGQLLGILDIRYAYALQIFELSIEPEAIPEALSQGIRLRLRKGDQPLWVLAAADSASSGDTLLPHLLLVSKMIERERGFFTRLASTASIQPFGWMEGCVLDGLYDLNAAHPESLRWRQVLQEHLDHYLDDEGGLTYENPRSEPVDSRVYGIEGTLPFAIIAKLWPEHPVLELALQFWHARAREGGGLIADRSVTAEGAYTVAYPLAVLARKRRSRELAELAVGNLQARRQALVTERGLCWIEDQGQPERYLNWARAYAWYMLGLVRSIVELRQMDPKDRPKLDGIELAFTEIAVAAAASQGSDGLWPCFLGEPVTGVDTSGSAGIAAAIAIGVHHGLLPPAMRDATSWAYLRLVEYLSPDGFLTGVAQSNRNGEALQRGGYRVISQMAMGLMGQLAAVLGHGEEKGRQTESLV